MGTGTPYIGFSGTTLSKQQRMAAGQQITCPTCGGKHALECGMRAGKESDMLLFYRCGDSAFLAAVDGRSIMDVPSDCHGAVNEHDIQK